MSARRQSMLVAQIMCDADIDDVYRGRGACSFVASANLVHGNGAALEHCTPQQPCLVKQGLCKRHLEGVAQARCFQPA